MRAVAHTHANVLTADSKAHVKTTTSKAPVITAARTHEKHLNGNLKGTFKDNCLKDTRLHLQSTTAHTRANTSKTASKAYSNTIASKAPVSAAARTHANASSEVSKVDPQSMVLNYFL